jgi:probable HAF family extracellular repeat protein
MRRLRGAWFALAWAAALAAGGGPAAAQGEGAVDLGALPGGSESTATGISDSGQVVGHSGVRVGPAEAIHAFFWTAAAGMVDLGTLPPLSAFANSRALAINNRNQVVGVADSPTGIPHAFLFEVDDAGLVIERRDLGTPPGFAETIAQGINNLGDVVGIAIGRPGGQLVRQAFFWSEATGFVLLPSLGGPNSTAAAINDSRLVVGTAEESNTDVHGVAWQLNAQGETLSQTVLEAPADSPPERNYLADTNPLGLNEAGRIVGWTNFLTTFGTAPSPVPHALLWPTATSPLDLGLLPGGQSAQAAAINAAEQVVGSADTHSAITPRGFVWTETTGMRDLSRLAGDRFLAITAGADLNDAGTVAATGALGDGPRHAFLLDLCPAEVSAAQVAVRLLGRARKSGTDRIVQEIEIRNRGRQPLPGPIALALEDLPAGVTLVNAAGVTTCIAPLGSPYLFVPTGADDRLGPGERARVTLVLDSARRRPGQFRARVLAGGLLP